MSTLDSTRRKPLLQHRDVTGIAVNNCTANTRLLKVRVIEARGLRKKDIFGTSDPYCQISLYKNNRSNASVCPTVQTKTIKRNLNPVWNEEFVFRVNDENRIVLQLFDHNRLTRDDFLGIVNISPLHIDIGTEGDGQRRTARSFKLYPRSVRSQVKGNLLLYLIYLPTTTNVRTLTISANRQAVPQTSGEGAAENAGLDSGRSVANRRQDLLSRSEGSSRSSSSDRCRDADPGTALLLIPSIRGHSPVADRDGSSSLVGEVEEEQEQVSSDLILADNAPLPPGWDERVDHNGRTYYVDHVNKRTQWDRPSCSLPEGWQQRTDPNGRVYYVDHLHHVTTWSLPLSDSAEVQPAQLPLPNFDDTPDDETGTLARMSIDAASGRARSSSPATGGRSSTSRPSADVDGASNTTPRPMMTANPDEAAREMFMSRRQVSLEDTVDSVVPQRATGLLSTLRGQRQRTNSTSPGPPVSSSSSISPNSTSPQRVERRHRTNSESAVERAASSASAKAVTGGHLDTTEPPLPAGWQMAVHSDGRKFFINHKKRTTTWVDPRERQTGSTTLLEDASSYAMRELDPLPPGWEERVHTDGRPFYINHNERTTHWEDPRLAKLSSAALPYSRNYIQKCTFFYTNTPKPKDPQAKLTIQVHRKSILEDTFNNISRIRKFDVLLNRLWIEFLGEKGLDYGGPRREFFYLLSRELFNPYYGLFEHSAADKYTLQINPSSGVANEDHLKYFTFCGCIMAMSIYHKCLIDAYFIRPFYKMMLGRPICLQDMEPVDDHMYRSLKYMLVEDLDDSSDFTFSVTEQRFGEIVEVDLIPDGRNIPVNNENKKKFVDCYIAWRYTDRVKPQMNALCNGFNRVMDLNHLKVFDANELELLMCGIQDINLADWKNNTLYKGDYYANHPVILSFWKTLCTFTREMQIRLLQFVTGTSRVPVLGFSQLLGSNGLQKFTIQRWGNPDQFPIAHTCFNRLDLPPYSTMEELKCKLIVAIENSEGFDGVD